MDNQTVINTTGEPVTEQVPAVDTTSTAPTALPSGYLENGYFATASQGGLSTFALSSSRTLPSRSPPLLPRCVLLTSLGLCGR